MVDCNEKRDTMQAYMQIYIHLTFNHLSANDTASHEATRATVSPTMHTIDRVRRRDRPATCIFQWYRQANEDERCDSGVGKRAGRTDQGPSGIGPTQGLARNLSSRPERCPEFYNRRP